MRDQSTSWSFEKLILGAELRTDQGMLMVSDVCTLNDPSGKVQGCTI